MAEPRFTPVKWSALAAAFFLTFFLVLYVWLCAEKGFVILGYATDDVSFHHFYTDHGWNLDCGLSTFWMEEGWTFVVEYDVAPKSGSAFFHLMRTFTGEGLGAGWTLWVDREEIGRAEYQAEKSALYMFSASGSGHGLRPEGAPPFDVKYAVWWGVAF